MVIACNISSPVRSAELCQALFLGAAYDGPCSQRCKLREKRQRVHCTPLPLRGTPQLQPRHRRGPATRKSLRSKSRSYSFSKGISSSVLFFLHPFSLTEKDRPAVLSRTLSWWYSNTSAQPSDAPTKRPFCKTRNFPTSFAKLLCAAHANCPSFGFLRYS